MEYQNIINLLGITSNQPSKFRTRNWVEINDESRGTCSTNSQIKFKTSMTRSNLCDYSDAFIHVKGTLTISNTGATVAADNRSKKVLFKNCASCTNCIREIINNQVDDTYDIDILMPMYSLLE